MRVAPRPLLAAIALGAIATACAPPDLSMPQDTTIPPATLIEIKAETSAPPTTPVPTAYPTIPPVTAVAPYWSPAGWTIPQVKSFLSMVDTALRDLGAEHSMDGTNGIATLDNGTTIDLTLLAAKLTLVPTGQWQTTVSTYLESILSPNQADTALTFEIAQPLLRVRVGTLGSLGLSIDQGVVQPIADDLVVAVCVEQATGTSYLMPAQLETWGKGFDEIMVLAIEQTLARPATTKQIAGFTSVVSDQFASSRLIDPSVVMQSTPRDGFLIAIPSLDQFLAVRVDSSLTVSQVNDLVARSSESFNTLNNPASPDLYWWRNGAITVLHPQGTELTVPADLRALLAG